MAAAVVAVLLLVLSALAMSGGQAMAAPCTAALGGGCGPYTYSGIPMSTGYDTYVSNQSFANSGTTAALTATDPGSWSDVVNAVPYGYGGVQMFPDSQQLTNDWNGNGWGGQSGDADTPLASLSALKISYSESMGTVDSSTSAEFAPDIWQDNYGDDVMFWADTRGRCNTGAYGSTVLGTAVLDGQTWTVNRYGGAGAEVIFVLDSNPAVPDSCAQQTSGTIDIQAGLNWLIAHGDETGPAVLSQVNTGFEVTSAANETFSMTSYSITATVGSSPPTGPVTSVNDTAKCVDDRAGSSVNGAQVQLWDCLGNANQQWAVNKDGTLTINGKCLDVTGQGTANGTRVELWTCNGGANQQWHQAVPGGELVSAQSGKCLDDPGFSTANGTLLDIWACKSGYTNIEWNLP